MEKKSNILSFEKFKLKKFLEENGIEWFDDKKGKVRIWIRKAAKPETKISGPFFPERP